MVSMDQMNGHGGRVGIKVNDEVGHYFQTKRGLCQGDPMPLILFNIIADMLVFFYQASEG
jgi:hypothetical protein